MAQESDRDRTKSWIVIAGTTASEERCATFRASAERRFRQKGFLEKDEQYLATLDRSVMLPEGVVSDRQLEIFRRLCATWYVDLKPPSISSHRRWIGPVIVTGKRLMYRMLIPLFSKLLKDEREFRTAAVLLFAELLQSRGNDSR